MHPDKIYGEPEEFAVSVTNLTGSGPMRMGECVIWLEGKSISTNGQSVSIEGLRRGLQGIVLAGPHKSQPTRIPTDSWEFLSMIEEDGIEDAGKHFFLAIDGFDDYLKLFFKNDLTTHFVWAIHPSHLHDSARSCDNRTDVIRAEISNEAIYRAVTELIASGI
jgi:hypothetical protein